jgi:hypothetical protein
LYELLEEASAKLGISVVSKEVDVPPFDYYRARDTRWIYFSWLHPETAPDEDYLAHIEPQKLQTLGEAFALVLTQVVRQVDY